MLNVEESYAGTIVDRLRCSTRSEGILRLACVGNELIINSTGNMIEIYSVAEGRPDRTCFFAETEFPNEDERSTHDMHMRTMMEWGDYLIAINRHGMIRFFPKCELQTRSGRLSSAFKAAWAGDCEWFSIMQSRLISTSPSCYQAGANTCPGIQVSQPLDSVVSFSTNVHFLQRQSFLMEWDQLTALAVHPSQTLLAVAARDKVSIFRPCFGDPEQTTLGPPQVTFTTPFFTTFIHFSFDDRIILAGYGLEHRLSDRADWSSIGGGGWLSLQLSGKSSHKLAQASFRTDLAWGEGSNPIAVDSDDAVLYGFDKYGGIESWSLLDSCLLGIKTAPTLDPLGVAQVVRLGDKIIYGYTRGGPGLQIHAVT